MQNSGGRATFNMNYEHSDLRMPGSLLADPHYRGPPRLSAEAKEFVPSFRLPTQMASNVGQVNNHLSYQQQQHLIHLQQFQSPQHLTQHPHPQQPPQPHQQAFHLQQQQAHPLHQAIQMQNHHPNQRRGGRHSVQDRLNPNADPQHMMQHHHHQQQQQQLHHHHQQHQHVQQQHMHQQHQHASVAVLNAANHQPIPRHQMHHVHKLEQQQHHQQHHNNHHNNHHHNNMRRGGHHNGHHAAAAAAAAPIANGGGASAHGGGEAVMTEVQIAALDFLAETIQMLIEEPGKFEQSQKELNALYIEFAQDNYVISNAIEMLFDNSITEQNFRYMGARICRLLDAIDATPNSMFRSLLKMKMDFNQQENQHFMTNEAHKVRGTTMFLAELFLQLQNDGSRMEDVASSICQSIDLLLQKTTPENIKCVCMALKLCGYDLEQDCPVDVGKFITALRQQKDIDVSTQRMIDSVLENASNRWGRNETMSMPAPIEHNQHQQEFSNEPVYYGPDGKIISEEESSFLSSILAAAHEPSFTGSDKEDDTDPEMDDEIKAAYQDFLKDLSN